MIPVLNNGNEMNSHNDQVDGDGHSLNALIDEIVADEERFARNALLSLRNNNNDNNRAGFDHGLHLLSAGIDELHGQDPSRCESHHQERRFNDHQAQLCTDQIAMDVDCSSHNYMNHIIDRNDKSQGKCNCQSESFSSSYPAVNSANENSMNLHCSRSNNENDVQPRSNPSSRAQSSRNLATEDGEMNRTDKFESKHIDTAASISANSFIAGVESSKKTGRTRRNKIEIQSDYLKGCEAPVTGNPTSLEEMTSPIIRNVSVSSSLGSKNNTSRKSAQTRPPLTSDLFNIPSSKRSQPAPPVFTLPEMVNFVRNISSNSLSYDTAVSQQKKIDQTSAEKVILKPKSVERDRDEELLDSLVFQQVKILLTQSRQQHSLVCNTSQKNRGEPIKTNVKEHSKIAAYLCSSFLGLPLENLDDLLMLMPTAKTVVLPIPRKEEKWLDWLKKDCLLLITRLEGASILPPTKKRLEQLREVTLGSLCSEEDLEGESKTIYSIRLTQLFLDSTIDLLRKALKFYFTKYSNQMALGESNSSPAYLLESKEVFIPDPMSRNWQTKSIFLLTKPKKKYRSTKHL
jgi:hypothetical protein